MVLRIAVGGLGVSLGVGGWALALTLACLQIRAGQPYWMWPLYATALVLVAERIMEPFFFEEEARKAFRTCVMVGFGVTALVLLVVTVLLNIVVGN